MIKDYYQETEKRRTIQVIKVMIIICGMLAVAEPRNEESPVIAHSHLSQLIVFGT